MGEYDVEAMKLEEGTEIIETEIGRIYILPPKETPIKENSENIYQLLARLLIEDKVNAK
ncbi:hypothetical protein [Solibacillus sp. FSL K6-1523]|uniref:hypothetical protein n=1 Tax=Solibacillus sp. FSL K6-1523 TaxID=2921471 RepID=UPI0030F671F3